MSLVVANKTDDGIILVCDTKITYKHDDLNPYLAGVVKITVLNDHCAVAFAGDLGHAKRGLGRLSADQTAIQVVESLRDLSTDSGFNATFIVASYESQCQLFRIRDGQADEVASVWIGDQEAFQAYQAFFTESDKSDLHANTESTFLQVIQMPEECSPETGSLYSRMFAALRAVIDSQVIKSVSGFVVPVFIHKKAFVIGSYFSLFRRPLLISELTATKGVVPFGDASTGTFSVNATGIGRDHFVVHIDQGQLGIIFSKQGSLLLDPEVLSNIDEIDFAATIASRFGSVPAFAISNSPGHYFRKAESHLRSYAFDLAESFLTEGVRVSSKSWKAEPKDREKRYDSLSACLEDLGPPLSLPQEEVRNLTYAFYLRGVCRFATGRITLALQDFRESLTLDETFYNSMVWLTRTHREMGNLDLAVEAAKRCCEKHNRCEALQLCSQLLLEMNRHEEAIEYLQQSLTLDSNITKLPESK
ncbi:MAG: hypothetical protein K8T91_06485 [Planctomycetes bacterium]|nr:hypothetical protein [Planctomycetota bacterium]